MRVAGIEVEKEVLKEFQEGFLGGRVAGLIGQVFNLVIGEAQATLEDCGAGIDRVRQAQGMVLAVRRFDEVTRALAKVDPEGKIDDGVDEIEEVGGTNVDF